MVVVSVDLDHDAVLGLDQGVERCTLLARLTDELTNPSSERTAIAQRCYDVLSGRDTTAPALDAVQDTEGNTILADWRILDVGRLGAKSYTESIEGHRALAPGTASRGHRGASVTMVSPAMAPTGSDVDLRTGAGAGCTTTLDLLPFQKRFMARVLSPDVNRAVFCLARGNGKSTLAGYIGAESVRPGGALFRAGNENVLLSGSLDQARYVFRAARVFLGEAGYRYEDNKQSSKGRPRVVRHQADREVFAGPRARLGLLVARLAIADEPGSRGIKGAAAS